MNIMDDNAVIVWVVANSAALGAIIFQAGIQFNRIKSLEYRVKDSEEKHEKGTAQTIQIATLGVQMENVDGKMDDLKESIEHVRRGVHDLRNQLTGRVTSK